jgi:hypothetical protein
MYHLCSGSKYNLGCASDVQLVIALEAPKCCTTMLGDS